VCKRTTLASRRIFRFFQNTAHCPRVRGISIPTAIFIQLWGHHKCPLLSETFFYQGVGSTPDTGLLRRRRLMSADYCRGPNWKTEQPCLSELGHMRKVGVGDIKKTWKRYLPFQVQFSSYYHPRSTMAKLHISRPSECLCNIESVRRRLT
jgi:hypothetical protein